MADAEAAAKVGVADAIETPGGYVLSLGTILLVILVIALLWQLRGLRGGPFYGTATTAAAGLALCSFIVLILVLIGKI